MNHHEHIRLQRRRRPTPPSLAHTSLTNLANAARRTSPRDARGSPRDHAVRRSPREMPNTNNLRRSGRNSPSTNQLEDVQEERTAEANGEHGESSEDPEDIERWIAPTEEELRERPSQVCAYPVITHKSVLSYPM